MSVSHARDLAAPYLIEMGEGCPHGSARCLVGAGVGSEGSDAVAIFEVGVNLGVVADPLGGEASENAATIASGPTYVSA